MPRQVRNEGADLLDFEASERCLRIKRGIRTVTALLVDGKFPDYEKVIPDSMPQEVVVSVAEMRSAMERVLVLRGADGASVSNPRVILDIKKDNMHSSTENDSGESIEEDIAVEHKGEGIKIAFNASYIKDILDNMDTEKARMSLKESSGSILMQRGKGWGRHSICGDAHEFIGTALVDVSDASGDQQSPQSSRCVHGRSWGCQHPCTGKMAAAKLRCWKQ